VHDREKFSDREKKKKRGEEKELPSIVSTKKILKSSTPLKCQSKKKRGETQDGKGLVMKNRLDRIKKEEGVQSATQRNV